MLRVLGPLEVDGLEGPAAIGGRIPRRVLCALLVRPGAVVSVDGLIEAAWGEHPPATAERTLVSHVTRLREALARVGDGDDRKVPAVEHRDGGYRLLVAAEAVDAGRFERAVAVAKSLVADDAVAALREALALWRAPAPFADLQDTAYPAAEAARCRFLLAGPDPAGVRATIRWTETGTARVPAPPGVTAVQHLDGRVTAVEPGGDVEITETPVLLR
jgi:DNA-binding winged helix-turn-helix (wHTH) protein